MLFHNLDRIADLLHGLCEVDDINSIALFEDEALHLWIPAVLLVAKMSTAF